ncbi:MAG: toxin-antitoxin system HicB family antitoxin [Acidobacteriia bacterium]|nr:toxin-antitoxin system HicB family antitoxin [Terriglobia bacterium]
MKETRTYPLRLPRSLKEAVERLSREDQTSMNQFIVTAVAEKVSALRTARYFAERKTRVDFAAFDKIMRRRGGKAPREGDEMPLRTK